MGSGTLTSASFVVKAEELPVLGWLDAEYPRPVKLEWINRATDQPLRPTTVGMLLRTLFRDVETPSIVRLHRSAGLRVLFRTDRDRAKFGTMFTAALADYLANRGHRVVALFNESKKAHRAVAALKDAGVTGDSISLLGTAQNFLSSDFHWPRGHSTPEVAGATLGGGLLGAAFGIAVLSIPGLGPVAIGGAIAASALSSVATIGGIMGATGGAIAKMLTDHDVDGVSAKYYENQIIQGEVLLLVDTRKEAVGEVDVLQLLRSLGGRTDVLV